MKNSKSVLEKIEEFETKINSLEEAPDPEIPGLNEILGRLDKIECALFGCTASDEDYGDSVLGSDEDDGGDSGPMYIVVDYHSPESKLPPVYLRQRPLKVKGKRKWWSTNKDEAGSFITPGEAEKALKKREYSIRAANISIVERD